MVYKRQIIKTAFCLMQFVHNHLQMKNYNFGLVISTDVNVI